MKENIFWARVGFVGIFLLGFPACSRHEPPFRLDSQNLSWGEIQMEKMVRDRPAMAKYAQKGDEVWNWTVRQFAGEWEKGGIEWDPADPVPLWDARYYGAQGNRKAYVQVTALSAMKNFHFGKPKEGPELWYDLVFEFCNFQEMEKSREITRLADAGKIGEEDYCFRKTFLEAVDTRRAVHRFFADLWVPNCSRLTLDPWGEFMKMANNVGIPVWTAGQFVDKYFNVDYYRLPERNASAEDYYFHHQFYKKQYEEDVVPMLLNNQIPVPTPIDFLDLKKKMAAEIR